jgi:4'-phosphopantetheinyl transferase
VNGRENASGRWSSYPLRGLLQRLSGPGRVDLWFVEVAETGPLGLHAACALLRCDPAAPDGRRAEDWRRSLIAQAALARLVAQRAGVDPETVAVGRDSGGRPVVSERLGLHVSIAHAGGFVACAAARRPVGVDIERADRPEADEGLAAYVCCAGEREQLAALPAAARRRALIRLWSRKEALSKVLGVGLALPFDKIDVRLGRPLFDGVSSAALWVRDVDVAAEGYLAAVAGEGNSCYLRTRRFGAAD